MSNRILRIGSVAILAAAAFVAGCKMTQPAGRTDQQITSDIQAKIQGESALNNQNIQVSVAGGVATLSGSVTDEASRSLAGNDSGTVAGVKTVVNNLMVQSMPAQAAPAPQPAAQPTPAPAAQAPARKSYVSKPQLAQQDQRQQSKPTAGQASAPAPEMAQAAPPPAPMQAAAPPPPPKPVVKTVTLPAGTVIPIRITEDLNSKTTQTNDVFHGSLASDIGVQGVIAIPSGADVIGRVVDAKDAAHFAGSALLSLELTEVTARGQKLSLVTDPFQKQGEGRGKNTAVKTGGGAALGAIIGGLAGGGKGAAIGGLAGAAAGTGVNAATRGQQVQIPSESLINFTLSSPVTLTVTMPPAGQDAPNAPQLQVR